KRRAKYMRRGYKMNKKPFLLLLAAMLLIGLAAGCGSKSNEQGPAATPAEQGGKGNSNGENKITLHYHSWYTAEEVKPIIEAFEAENQDIKVAYHTLMENGTSNEAMGKLDMLLASGEKM